MKKNLLRGLLVAGLTAAMLLSACGGRDGNNGGGTATPVPTAVPTAPPSNNGGNGNEDNGGNDEQPGLNLVWQEDAGFREIPADLNGRLITIMTVTGRINQFQYWDPIDATPNETLDIMARIRDIENDYNTKIEFEVGEPGTIPTSMVLNRAVGETPWDLIYIGTNHTSLDNIFVQNLVMDLSQPSIAAILDFDNNPWSAESSLTNIFGRQYGVHFHMANSGFLLRSTITFNRDLMETYNLPNLYEMVWNKDWNFTNFQSVLTSIWTASGGNVIPLTADRESQFAPNLIISNGGLTTESTPGGLVFVAHENERALEAMDFMVGLLESNLLVYNVDFAIPWIAQGEAMMIAGNYENLRRFTRQDPPTEYSFGLLPMPKGNHMDDYVSAVHAADMFFIPADIRNPEDVAKVLVAMANRISKINIIATELDFGVQDMESARILEMLLDRIEIDFSRALGARSRIGDAVNMMIRGEATPRQAFEQFAAQVQTSYDNLHPR
jgi:ABC-type glycerol-3-phosphate transport system substrate-binding protein